MDELDPRIVIWRAVELVRKYPQAAPVVSELMRTYIEVLHNLGEDWGNLGEAS